MTTTTTRYTLIRSLAITLVVLSGLFGVAFVGAQEKDISSDETGAPIIVQDEGEKKPQPEPEPVPAEDDEPAGGDEGGGQETTVDDCIPDDDFELRQLRDQYFKIYNTFDLAGGTVSITNEHPTCSFPFALKSFQVYSDPIHQIPQTLFDSDEKTIGPGQTKSFRVDLPSCRYQLDVVAFPGNQNYSSSAKLIKGQVYQQLPLCVENPDWTPICVGLPDPASIGEPVTWTASVSGVTGVFSYLWNGNGAFPDGATTNPVVVTYTSPGVKNAAVAVTFGGETKTAQCSITIPTVECPVGQPSITSPASASGQVGELFSHTVTTAGGLGTIVTITPITPAPGLSINGTIISGTPTQTGTYTYSVKAQNADGDPACGPTQILTIIIGDVVDECPVQPTITSTPSPTAMLGVPYFYKVTTTGGVAPISISINPVGPAAPGLVIDTSASTIAGTPTTPGVYTYAVTATSVHSSLSCATPQIFTITVGQTNQCPAKPTITSSNTAVAGLNLPFSHTVTTSGGIAPVSIAITAVNAAPGLSINGSTISGTVTAVGTYTYIVKATSANSGAECAVPQTFTITVSDGPICIPPTNLFPSGTLAADTTSVTLSWTPVAGAVSYNIRLDDGTTDRYDDPRFTTCANSPHYYCENNLTTTNVTNVPVKPGRTYSFWVDPNFAPGRNYCNAGVKFTIPSTKPVPECTLEATPESIQNGDTVTLTWTSKNVTSASIDQGIGSVPLNGSTTTQPTADTTYIASFTGPYGSIACKDGVVIKTPGDDDDDDDDDDDGGGGGGGGHRRRPNVVLFSEPEVLGTSISLTQIPYTGLGTSILQLVLFILGLLAISGGIIYAIMRRRISPASSVTVTAGPARTTVSVADSPRVEAGEPIDEPALAAYEEYAYAAPRPVVNVAAAPANIPVVASVAEAPHASMNTLPSVQKNADMAPVAAISAARIQNEARASRTLISDDGAELIAHSAEGDEKKALERLNQIVEIAKSRYPREDGWLILDKDRVRETLFISTLSMIPLFVEWIIRGEDKKVFTFLRMLKHQEQPVADFMRKVVSDLDNAYRARMEGTDEHSNVNQHIAEVTYHLSNKELETIVGELLHGVDERYDSAYTSVRLSLVRVLDIIKERSLRAVGSAYAFADEAAR